MEGPGLGLAYGLAQVLGSLLYCDVTLGYPFLPILPSAN